MPDRPVYRLTLEALPDDVPATVRLKVALKRLGRCYKLRCVSAEELSASGESPPESILAQSTAGPADAPGRRGVMNRREK